MSVRLSVGLLGVLLWLRPAPGMQGGEPMAALKVGDRSPAVALQDLDGQPVPHLALEGWVVVYTGADRKSSDALMAWQQRVGVSVAQSWPWLKVAYVNVADLQIVPSLMREVVRPYLFHATSSALTTLAETYDAAGLTLGPEVRRFYMVPDWDGALLPAFGVTDAKRFRAWVAKDGVVRGTFQQGQVDLDGGFLRLFEGLALE